MSTRRKQKPVPPPKNRSAPPRCRFPECGRQASRRSGLCPAHQRQRRETGRLKPIRLYRPRMPGTVRLGTHRVTPETAEQVMQGARERNLSVGAMISDIIERWATRPARQTK